MDLTIFEMQLNEERVNNKMKDLRSRLKELRALNNSGDEICKKLAQEFNKTYDQVRTMLLPPDLKKYAKMTNQEMFNVGEQPLKELTRKYKKIGLDYRTMSKAAFLNNLMNDYIAGKNK